MDTRSKITIAAASCTAVVAALISGGTAYASSVSPAADGGSHWTHGNQPAHFHGAPKVAGGISSDFVVEQDGRSVALTVSEPGEGDFDFDVPVQTDSNGRLVGSVPLPNWGNGGDVMTVTLTPRVWDGAGDVTTSRLEAQDKYDAFDYGVGWMAIANVDPDPLPCGTTSAAWAGRAIDQTVFGDTVGMRFSSDQASLRISDAFYKDTIGMQGIQPDGDVHPESDGTIHWKAGAGPFYKNLVNLTAPKCNAAGLVTSVTVQAATFPDPGITHVYSVAKVAG